MRRAAGRGDGSLRRGGVDPNQIALRANGYVLVRQVLAQPWAGELTYRQAKDRLGVSYQVLLGLKDRLARLKPPGGSKRG